MSYKHLSRDDRIRLDVLLRNGSSIKDCARGIGFSRQTVSSEVNSNGGKDRYNPYKANRKTKERRHKANQCHRKWSGNNWYTKVTIRLLKLGWSPEQVMGRIMLELDQKPFCFTTVYNNVNPDKVLCKLLPRQHNRYRRRKDGNERKVEREELRDKKSIDIRPDIVETRERIGDWEADTIIGKETKSRILTNVERKSGYLLASLLKEVSARIVLESQVKLFSNIPDDKKHTITQDNGTEFTDYELVEKQCKIDIYHANPYHSWERGTSENTNGLIRRYFPKGTYFGSIRKEQLIEVVKLINTRARKRLGYRTPYEVFNDVKLRTIM